MLTRGPKTRSAFQAEGVIVPGLREPAPLGLEPAEVSLWDAIVQRLPVDWFTSENRPLLKGYVRHVCFADAFAADIAALRGRINQVESMSRPTKVQWKQVAGWRKELYQAHRMHAAETSRADQLATRLRLTNQSRYARETAGSKATDTTNERPWSDWGHASITTPADPDQNTRN